MGCKVTSVSPCIIDTCDYQKWQGDNTKWKFFRFYTKGKGKYTRKYKRGKSNLSGYIYFP